MNYKEKVSRWTLGTGKVFYERTRLDFITVLEKTGESSSLIRANILRQGKKKYELVLFQGHGHKDTIYKTNRWMNVRETLGNFLCDIDRALERPLTKFRLPTEEECFAPRAGDVVVFTKPETSYLGELGVIRENIPETGSFHIDNGFQYPGQHMDYYASEFEVIDHDPQLLEEPENETLESSSSFWIIS